MNNTQFRTLYVNDLITSIKIKYESIYDSLIIIITYARFASVIFKTVGNFCLNRFLSISQYKYKNSVWLSATAIAYFVHCYEICCVILFDCFCYFSFFSVWLFVCVRARLRSFVFFPCNQNEFDFRSSLFAANSYCWFELALAILTNVENRPAIRSSVVNASVRFNGVSTFCITINYPYIRHTKPMCEHYSIVSHYSAVTVGTLNCG